MRLAVMCCALLLVLQLNAQTKIFRGFYVTTNADTIKGSFPKYSQWSRNPEKVEFIPAGSSNSLQLTPLNCLAFSIDQYDDYISFSGQRLLNPIEDDAAINNASSFFNSEDSISSVTVFLRLVIKTPLCEIFVLNDQIRANFYYKLPGQNIQELKFKRYFSEGSLHDITEYKAQLHEVFSEELLKKNLVKKLGELSYNEEDIENFIGQLSGITKPSQKKQGVSWIVLAGASINFLDVSGDLSIQEVRSDFDNTVSPFISIGFILPVSRNFNRFFIYPQLRAYNFKNTTSYSSTYTKHVITYHSQLCILPEVNGGINIVNNQNCRLFLYGGAGMLFLVKNRQTDQRISLADGSATPRDVAMSKLTYSCNLSGGVVIKDRFIISSSYHLPVPVANFVLYSAMHSNLQIGIGYKFK